MQKGAVQLLLILFLVILVFGGGYIYFNSRGFISKGPTENIAPLAKSAIQLTKYLDQNLGFEFTYPKDLQIKVDSEEEFNKRGNGDFRKNFKGYVGYEPGQFLGAVAVLDKDQNFDNNPFSVWIFNNDNNLTIEQWFDKYWYYPFVWGVFDYTSKGHIALDTEATVSGEMAKSKVISYQPGQPKYIYVAKNSKMYLFRIIDASNKISDQILSTFKFFE